MKIKFLAAAVTALVASNLALAGEKGGNGGDIIRAAFIAAGESIVDELRGTTLGQSLVSRYHLNVEAMTRALNIKFIQVKVGPLLDNRGSVVDALGSAKGVNLDRDSWRDYVLAATDFRKMVFHELLRVAEANDDGYPISSLLPKKESRTGYARADGAYTLLQKEFSESPVPSLEDLKARFPDGNRDSWFCTRFEVFGRRGYSNWADRPALWRDSGFQLDMRPADPGSADRVGSPIFTYDEFGLSTAFDPRTFAFIRQTAMGELIVEIAVSNSDVSPFSSVVPALRAESYAICSLRPYR